MSDLNAKCKTYCITSIILFKTLNFYPYANVIVVIYTTTLI